jgi:hypothetical protein
MKVSTRSNCNTHICGTTGPNLFAVNTNYGSIVLEPAWNPGTSIWTVPGSNQVPVGWNLSIYKKFNNLCHKVPNWRENGHGTKPNQQRELHGAD